MLIRRNLQLKTMVRSLLNDGSTNRLWLGYTEDPAQLIKEGHGLMRWEGTQLKLHNLLTKLVA